MESIINFIFEHAPYAHWIVFGILLLSGINLPVSEDLLIIISGILASRVIPEHTFHLYISILIGCFISDNLAYWIGRTLGRKLWNIKWFARTIPPKRLDQVQTFYDKYGFYTLIIGRFIPFGIRNCLFFTAGISKMKIGKFVGSDATACLLSNSVLFFSTYALGKNYQSVLSYLRAINIFTFTFFTTMLIGFICHYKRKKHFH